jgi:UDP-GlcNAc:undecaprenyl-phosphate GlcNAc-1-phosphate transferase
VRRVLTGDRAHVHHRLLSLGLSHRAAVLTLYALMLVFSGLALVTMEP